MRKFFGYIRVSTARQGEHGVSLQEQRDAIARYSQRGGLELAEWFEERETAAKQGRPVFNRMLGLLGRGKADGVIIHKIDRSARNLKDWADLGGLIDQGIEVHFANESLDLHSRGGRLSADIQAVVAADYIRNLREETRKGFYGRLKQGLYPLPAPLGYVDKGKAKPKELDPIRSPLVRQAFQLYASNNYSLDTLVDAMFRRGLRNRRGGKLTRSSFSHILNNSFYIGIIRLLATGETFQGCHEALISKSLFDRVQDVLSGKTNTKIQHHDFLFRRLLRCAVCGYSLTGENQKGHIYYRCHMSGCGDASVREEVVEAEVIKRLSNLQFSEDEEAYLRSKLASLKQNWDSERNDQINALNLRVGQLQDRLGRLTDAYVDRVIDKDIFEEGKAALLNERKATEEQLLALTPEGQSLPDRLAEFFELAKSAYLQYKLGLPDEKRYLLKIVSSNRLVSGKKPDITLSLPFNEVENRLNNTNGGPHRHRLRTFDGLVLKLWDWFKANPCSKITCDSDLDLNGSKATYRSKGK